MIKNAYFCIKTEKKNNFIAFHDSFIPKRLKKCQKLKNVTFVLWLPWQRGCRNDINYDMK